MVGIGNTGIEDAGSSVAFGIVWHSVMSVIFVPKNILLKVEDGLLLPKGAVIKEEVGCRVEEGRLLIVVAVESTHVIRNMDSSKGWQRSVVRRIRGMIGAMHIIADHAAI